MSTNIDQQNNDRGGLFLKGTRMQQFLERLKQQTTPPRFCGIRLEASFKDVDTNDLLKRLGDRNLISPLVLAERMLARLNMESEARDLNLTVPQCFLLYAAAVELLTPEQRASMEREMRHPRATGLLPIDDPTIAPMRRAIEIDKRRVTTRVIEGWTDLDRPFLFLPGGRLRSVDHRPKFGPARDQSNRWTCTSFCATALAEALEYLRDRRPGPRDLSEEFLWWYSKNGQLNSTRGYDHTLALEHYERNGVPDEFYLPYLPTEMIFNQADIPVPDDAIDRAFDYRQPPWASLPEGDLDAVKAALRSGRCVAIDSDAPDTEWHEATGLISFPTPFDSRARSGGHCVAIIGYIDRDGLPTHFRGGYFIIRNSWGGTESTEHVLGTDYSGHLLMPYGWYLLYTTSPAVFGRHDDPTGTTGARQWRAEYYPNKSLGGIPTTEPVLDVDLTRSPLPSSDDFSARFTQLRRLRSGWHRFILQGAGGMRLWVDDRLVINHWYEQTLTTHMAEHYVTGGDHVLRVEYFDTRGSIAINLRTEEIEFHYELFANTEVAGGPAAAFDDTMIDLEWRHAPPVDTPDANGHFSLRATGRKHFAAGTYTFHVRHTGGCRMWIDDNLVLDDWTGGNENSGPVSLTDGVHNVRVEFAHREAAPDFGAGTYYRAALNFDWSEAEWTAQVYRDEARERVWARASNSDGSIYEAFRVQQLTEAPILSHRYSVPPPAGTSYSAGDGPNFQLNFPNPESFMQGVPGAGIAERPGFSSAIFTRRVYLPRDGRYQLSIVSEEICRVCIDGNKVIDWLYLADPHIAEVLLRAGVHDVTIECSDAGGKRTFDFILEPANWSVRYFAGINFERPVSRDPVDVPGAEFIISDRPATLAAPWSARATRTIELPVGRFRIIVRAGDGVRVKANENLIISAWKTQPPTTYTAVLEHSGGPVAFEIEYFQETGGSLSFELKPDGFIGEYYRGIKLEVPDDPRDRNPPHAYRFEPTIDFDWGGTGRLARVGSDKFSARWWGSIELPVGRWKFKVTSDDGVRLFLDGQLLIDRWIDQAETTHQRIVDLAAGRRAVRLEYYERAGNAICRLELERLFGPAESIPI
jgi:hypothetical protein